jgi:hypothetical protein
MTRWFVPLMAVALATPLTAQQWQVARDQFAFAGRQLTVHIDAEDQGTLRIIRGPAGTVRVAGRSDAGFTAAGLTADEHLTLTAVGYGPVDYVVTVPERVWVTVHLPDRPPESMGTMDRGRTFHWEAAAQHEGVAAAPVWMPEPNPMVEHPSAYTVLASPVAPGVVTLPDLRNVRSVTVRVEGSTFRVGASRPLALRQGDPAHLEIRPGGPPMEIIVVVPAGTAGFTLSAGGSSALAVDGDRLTVFCSPSTRQWLSEGRGWVTFTPVGGTLDCGPTITPGRRG